MGRGIGRRLAEHAQIAFARRRADRAAARERGTRQLGVEPDLEREPVERLLAIARAQPAERGVSNELGRDGAHAVVQLSLVEADNHAAPVSKVGDEGASAFGTAHAPAASLYTTVKCAELSGNIVYGGGGGSWRSLALIALALTLVRLRRKR